MDMLTLAIALGYTKKQVEEAKREGFRVQVERDRSILDRAGEEKVFYFLPKSIIGLQDGYDEFVYANNNWEKVGATDVDLSSYVTKSEVGDLNNLPTTDKSSIVSAISETFTSVSNGKLLVASAITDKGVSTSSDATFEIMARNIEAIPSGAPDVSNPALVLWDWEGTKLAEYSREDALVLTELPAPETLFPYAGADHELLVFQSWNWSLADIKAWLTNNPNEKLNVVAIYTTSDSENHNYWANPRGEDSAKISMQKRATTNLANAVFKNYYSLKRLSVPNLVTYVGSGALNNCYNLQFVGLPNGVKRIDDAAFQNDYNLQSICLPNGITAISNQAFQYCSHMESITIPDTVTTIGNSVFKYCFALKNVHLSKSATSIEPLEFNYCYSLNSIWIPSSITQIKDYAFTDCSTLYDVILEGKPTLSSTNVFNSTPVTLKFYVPRANLSWFEAATNWSTMYSKFVAIEDNIEYLESLGYNVDVYKGGAA